MLVTLIRLAITGPIGSINNEATPAIGLAYIAGVCSEQGVEVHGIDATGRNLGKFFKIPECGLQGNGIEIDEILNLIDPRTKLIGISLMFSQDWVYNRECIKKIKKKFPNAIIVVGGEHATALPEYTLRDCDEIDYIAMGEGEETWKEILGNLENNKSIDEIKALAYIKDGTFIKTPFRARIKHIDQIPWPDWKVFPIEPYLDNSISFGAGTGRDMPILASRGCPYECTFCSNPLMFGRRYYLRQIDDLIKQIKYYIQKYKITGLQFYDLTAIIKKDWVIEFCAALKKEGINLNWSLPSGTRSEVIDLEVVTALAKANLSYLVYAPESGSPETLKLIKKKVKLDRMEDSIKGAVSQGITVRTNMILGFPNETRGQLYRTLYQQMKFAIIGVDDTPFWYYQPYPGTEIFDELINEKRIILNDKYFNDLATFSSGNLSLPAESFNKIMSKYELFIYRTVFMSLTYILSYIIRPKRILMTIKNLFRDKSTTNLEQRIKDKLRRSEIFNKHIKPFVNKRLFKKP
jgi:anaerobic magnesium-protoporphyrin IX monomethyl ester cyclase